MHFLGGRERDWLETQRWLDEEDTLEATYWIFDEPNIPNLFKKAGDFLQSMYDKFSIRPVIIDNEEKIFEARYEVVIYGEKLTYPEAIISPDKEVTAFIDFLGGVPYGAMEMSIMLWELASKADKYPVLPGEGGAVPPIPRDFFDETFEEERTLFNYLYLDKDGVVGFADGLSGEQETELLWWTRYNYILPDEEEEPRKYPVPGEFVAMGHRLFPTKPWGDQETSPFLFSGNWFDTLYYTTAIVVGVTEPTDEKPFPLYRVKWRGAEEESNNEFLAKPSGFETYQEGDRVAVLKNVATERVSQTWKDDQEFQEILWRLVPITFYEIEEE